MRTTCVGCSPAPVSLSYPRPLYVKWTERNAGKPRDRWAGFGMDLNGLRSRILRKHREELQRVGFSKAEANQSAQDCRDMAQLRTLAED